MLIGCMDGIFRQGRVAMELYSMFVNLIAIAAIVGGLVLGGWWVIALYFVHSRKEEKELPEIELPERIHEVFTGIPPALILFYAFIGLSMILYVLYIWLGRVLY